MLKSVLKCIASIRIQKWVKKIKIPSANLVGGGVQAKLVKSQLKKKPSTPPFIETVEMESRERIIGVNRHETIGQ